MRTQHITENNKLNAACLHVEIWSFVSTEINSGVSELCWVDIEVTCDMCSVVHWSDVESRWKRVEDIIAGVDAVLSTVTNTAGGRHTRTVVPNQHRVGDVTATLKCHRWTSQDCCVQRSTYQRRCYTCAR